LANLLELYAHDFSEFFEIELGEDGRFGYKDLPGYFREPNRRAFLVRVDNKLAGLVLVKRGLGLSDDEIVWDMAEFFVVRRYRRRGIGTYVAHEVWRQVPGLWEVRVMESNHAAHLFWRIPSRHSLGRRCSQVTFKPVASPGGYSHLTQSLSRTVVSGINRSANRQFEHSLRIVTGICPARRKRAWELMPS
jgi:predicted acetyltransferase